MTVVLMWSGCAKKPYTEKKTSIDTAKKGSVSTKRRKVSIPKVIVVSDKAARRSVDGRYYYDVDGHRYWRSKKDGKYYLFNRSMYDDSAFQPR